MDEVKKQIEQLELFNEKVHEFRASSFAEAIFAPDSGISLSFGIGKASTIERHGPTVESIRAWAPSIRLLISAKREGESGVRQQILTIIYGPTGSKCAEKWPEKRGRNLNSEERTRGADFIFGVVSNLFLTSESAFARIESGQ